MILRKLLYAVLALIFLIPMTGGVKAQQETKELQTWNVWYGHFFSYEGFAGNKTGGLVHFLNFDFSYFKLGLNIFYIHKNQLLGPHLGFRYPIGKWKNSKSDFYIQYYFMSNIEDSLGVRDFVEVPELLEVGYDHSMEGGSVKTGYRFQSGDWLKTGNNEIEEIGRLDGLFLSFSFGLQMPHSEIKNTRNVSSSLFYYRKDAMRTKKNYWLWGTIFSSAAGIYYQASSNNHYDEYVSATDDATRLHNIAMTEEMYALSGFTIAATSLMHYLYYRYEEKAMQ